MVVVRVRVQDELHVVELVTELRDTGRNRRCGLRERAVEQHESQRIGASGTSSPPLASAATTQHESSIAQVRVIKAIALTRVTSRARSVATGRSHAQTRAVSTPIFVRPPDAARIDVTDRRSISLQSKLAIT